MFMDICKSTENLRFSKISYCWKCDFLDFNLTVGRFYKMRVSWEFNIYNLLSPFINTVLSFSKYDVNIICG